MDKEKAVGLTADIQSDTGEIYSVIAYGGGFGKSLANFLMGYWGYCANGGSLLDDNSTRWFFELEKAATSPFCHFSPMTEKATISTEGNFDEFGAEDYEKYVSLYGADEIKTLGKMTTLEEFVESVHHWKNAWTDINLLLDFAATMLKIFREVQPEEDESWYHPEYSVADFEALERLLLDLSRVNVKRVRIVIG